MADDINEQVFNEKQLYTGDVVGEDDGDGRPVLHPLTGDSKSAPSQGPTELSAEKAKSAVSGRERRRKRASVRATQIVYWLETKYDILYEVCSEFANWKEAPTVVYDFDLFWSDQSIAADRFMKLKLYQKMNHFVGMSSITRKNNLGRNLLRMRKQFPTEYRFFPDTWILPTDLSDFKLQFTAAKNKTFIIKPDNGCQGKGIFLIRDGEKVPVDFSTTYVAQRYIHRPFLLDGHKFDLRLYVLVMGCDPLRIFLHRRGLVRLATETYVEPTSKNLSAQTVHLTNYAINKMSPNYEENTDPDDAHSSHKRSWEAVLEYLRALDLDVDTMMQEIEDLIVKTLIAVQPSLSHFYHSCQPDDVENSMCFEILGFDVILDHKLQPWLLEVNHAPSFATESELDKIVKEEVVRDTFKLLHLSPDTRRRHKREAREKMEQRAMGVAKKQSLEERSQEEHEIAKERTEWEDANLNGYQRLYPSEAKERAYAHIHDAAINIWEMLMGGNSRRSVRLTQEEVSEEKAEKSKKGDDGRGGDAPGNVRERRSADEMREVVERLSAGCSARPREACKTRKRGSKFDSSTADSTASTAPSTNPLGSDEEIPEGEAVDEAAKAELKPASEPKSLPRPDVQVGDVIKVQTNLGWEAVTVKAKRTNGKIDIQFKDGEYMRSVLPRILRESVPTKATEQTEKEKDASEGGQQASLLLSAPASALPKTARSSAAKDSASSASDSWSKTASKVPSLPSAVSPIDQARAAGAAAAAAAAVAPTPISNALLLGQMGAFASSSSDQRPLGQAPSSASSSSSTAAAVVSGASSVIAAAANAIAGTMVNVDSAAPSQSSTAAAGVEEEEAISPFTIGASLGMASNDRSILAQLQKQRARTSNATVGGDSNSRGNAAAEAAMQQAQPRNGTGLRPGQTSVSGSGVWAPPPPENKVHEARLRNHLQQLISVRPIVTRRKGGTGAEDAAKSPRSSAVAASGTERAPRRSSSNPYR